MFINIEIWRNERRPVRGNTNIRIGLAALGVEFQLYLE